jgi:hypothetical protein
LDNCRVNFSKATEQFITENHIERVSRSPYSLDLAPSDIRLFGHMKTLLVGQTFGESEQLLKAITEFLKEIKLPEVVAVFSDWVERVRCVSENSGDYDHE